MLTELCPERISGGTPWGCRGNRGGNGFTLESLTRPAEVLGAQFDAHCLSSGSIRRMPSATEICGS